MLKDVYCCYCDSHYNPDGEIHVCSNDTEFPVSLTQEQLNTIEYLANLKLTEAKSNTEFGFDSNWCLLLETIIEKMRKA
jgi:hypothetical protein